MRNASYISDLLKRDFSAVAGIAQKPLAEIATVFVVDPSVTFTEADLLKKQPARRFEKENGLHGLVGQYAMPENMKLFELENILVNIPPTTEALPLYNNLWERLKALNPALKHVSVKPDDPRCMDYALMGVVSGFNIDDINFFLKGHKAGIPSYTYSQNPPSFRKLYDEIERRIGAPHWVPAPATFQKIKSQLDSRQPINISQQK